MSLKITKYVHSCLLIETPERVGIIDPGDYSWKSGLLSADKLDRLDDILITHEHPDHMHVPFIQALVEKFPHATITTTEPAAKQLRHAGLTNVATQGNQHVERFAANHESVAPLGAPPANTGIHYLGLVTDPGDSHHFAGSRKVLALPITAPWGTLARAAAVGVEAKPEYIVPVHDWPFSDEARAATYDRLASFFAGNGITFLKPTDGVAMELAY